jgi:MFS family permease
VPVGIFGTYWAYRHLREIAHRRAGRIDWWGNLTFAGGLGAILVAITFGIRPYASATMGWMNPATMLPLVGGVALLTAFVVIERMVREPMLDLALLRIREFAAGMFTALAAAVARGGLQIMLVIWLQGVWLPMHGVHYEDAPLWAGIALLPLSVGFLIAGPVSGHYSDRFGARTFATTGLLVSAAGFLGLMLMPTDFSYPTFAVLLGAVGIGQGMFSAPNTAAIMNSVPPGRRGVASGMRATFQNAGNLLSIGTSFSVMIAGLSGALPQAVFDGLRAHGVTLDVARSAAALPAGVSLFSAFLGVNPMLHLLGADGTLHALSASARRIISDQAFYPRLIAQPFHDGLVAVLSKAAGLSIIAAIVSLFRTVERKDHQ